METLHWLQAQINLQMFIYSHTHTLNPKPTFKPQPQIWPFSICRCKNRNHLVPLRSCFQCGSQLHLSRCFQIMFKRTETFSSLGMPHPLSYLSVINHYGLIFHICCWTWVHRFCMLCVSLFWPNESEIERYPISLQSVLVILQLSKCDNYIKPST